MRTHIWSVAENTSSLGAGPDPFSALQVMLQEGKTVNESFSARVPSGLERRTFAHTSLSNTALASPPAWQTLPRGPVTHLARPDSSPTPHSHERQCHPCLGRVVGPEGLSTTSQMYPHPLSQPLMVPGCRPSSFLTDVTA